MPGAARSEGRWKKGALRPLPSPVTEGRCSPVSLRRARRRAAALRAPLQLPDSARTPRVFRSHKLGGERNQQAEEHTKRCAMAARLSSSRGVPDFHHVLGLYFGTRRPSSSNQFWTRINSVRGWGFAPSALTIRNARPSGHRSQFRTG